MSYRLIVFDWDGTIIDSPAAIVQCIQEAAREMGLRVPEAERASHVIGLGLADSLQLAVPDLPAHRYAEFVALYRKHFRAREVSMPLFEGMKDLLAELKGRTALAIATGKSRRGLDRALDATGLRPLFASSRCADETHPKPHPAMLLELMDEFGVSNTNTIMIGDTSHDLEMARAAGVDAVAVTYGAHPETGLRACGPRGCVASVAELRTWLTQNG
ncbi:MAG: HAD family hydrolase [Betaproteobacteria bacterium]